MIVTAWFLMVVLQDGSEKVVNEPFPSLSACLAFEQQVTEDFVETKCFYGPMSKGTPGPNLDAATLEAP